MFGFLFFLSFRLDQKLVGKSANIIGYEGSKIVHHQKEATLEYLMLFEYCSGGTLAELVRERTLSLDEILSIFSQICNAVLSLHSQRAPIAHRDIRMENIILHENGQWKLGDFGSCTTETLTCKTNDERTKVDAIISVCCPPFFSQQLSPFPFLSRAVLIHCIFTSRNAPARRSELLKWWICTADTLFQKKWISGYVHFACSSVICCA
jgi:serine/threonine protein kinase